jgi:hypothetical protein
VAKTYQVARHAFTGKSYSPDANAANDFDEYMGSTWMDCIAVTVRPARGFNPSLKFRNCPSLRVGIEIWRQDQTN